MQNKVKKMAEIMAIGPVIAIVTVNDPAVAVKIANALYSGGIRVVEITLRTLGALDCIKAVLAETDDMIIGAGTVLHANQIEAVEKAGAHFMVSPGFSKQLLDACDNSFLPMLPGAITPADIMNLGERGYRQIKFFPAGQPGGIDFLRCIQAPLSQFKFFPSGNLNQLKAEKYLQLDHVACVGGSWMIPKNLIETGKWNSIIELSKCASKLYKKI